MRYVLPVVARFQVACLLIVIASSPSFAQSLPQRIDQAVRAKTANYDQQAAPLANDAEFLRRVTLDLTGVIPTATEARAFLADKDADKRTKLVDRLLASDGYARHMQTVFDALLMDRRPEKNVKRAEWNDFLRSSFAANKPYDEFVREILTSDGGDPKKRAAARFYLDRDGEPHVLTKDISRLFLGTNLQCAQCHDHPSIDDYKQDHYYGIFAFLNRSYVIADKATKLAVYAEKAEGDTTFQSVFIAKVTNTTGPKLPGKTAIAEPKFDKGQEYAAPVPKGERGIPKFSRRAQLAPLLTQDERFARAAANRFWSLLFGRGIVHPVEYDHPNNPPSHPELLDQLTNEFRVGKHDVKAFIRSLVLSQTYQRSSEMKSGQTVEPSTFAVAPLRPLSPEALAWSMLQATGMLDAERKAKTTEPVLFAKHAATIAPFVNLFASLPGEPAIGQDFEATLDQTLFLNNGALVRSWIAPRAGNLADRLAQLKEAGPLAEELYVSVLTRLPSAEERQEVEGYLARRTTDRPAAVQELIWALVTSVEFRFNH
jgi:hypothetical protein